jgi:hypothetical protein
VCRGVMADAFDELWEVVLAYGSQAGTHLMPMFDRRSGL